MSASGANFAAYKQQPLRGAEGSGIAPAFGGEVGSGQFAAHLPEIYRDGQDKGGNGKDRGTGGKNEQLVAQLAGISGSGIVRTAQNLKRPGAPVKGETVKLATGNAAWTYNRTNAFEDNRRVAWDPAGPNGGKYLATNGKAIKVEGMAFNAGAVAVPNPSMPNDWNRQLAAGMTMARVGGARSGLMGPRSAQYNLSGTSLRA